MTPLLELEAKVQARRALPTPELRRAMRKAAGLSMLDIATAMGVSRQAVAHWEAGTRHPRAEHLASYLQVLGVIDAVRR